MLYETTHDHTNIANKGFYYNYFTIFENCQSGRGGAIYISSDSDVVVISCIFMRCKATSENGRGAAIKADNGNIACQYSCSDHCESCFGGDFQTGAVDKSLYFLSMQMIHSSMKYHPTFFASKNQIIKYSNWSQTLIEDSSNNYGSILSLSYVQNFVAQFLNGINCHGMQALFSFEQSDNQSPSISHINICNNPGLKYIVSFRGTSALNVLFLHCNFYGNDDIIYYFLHNTNSENNNLKFQNCSFSIQEIETSNVQIDDCEFNQKGIVFNIANKCFAQIISTFEKRRIVMPKTFLFTIFAMSK